MIRVRFAPSPTGFLHIGSLRTCFYNYLFAKKNKGKLILRIEDTDRKRYVDEAIENIIRILQFMGLDYDEGPTFAKASAGRPLSQKGKYGPYIQSQRLHIYQNLAQKLIDDGYAYYCFCSAEELKKMRQEQIAQKKVPGYDRRCRYLKTEEINKKLQSGVPYVIRLKVPEEGSIRFKDLIRGEIEFDLKNIDDQILIKSDGWPTYHLANVIDDHLMNITHVIRGEEWLPSMPKHLIIYQIFKWQPPQFAHLPLLLNPDRSKLSKRQSDVAVEDYLNQGYLPQTLLNFIALLGWNPDTNQEIFNLKELVKYFSLEKIQKAGAIFNQKKLDWMNGYYIRKMDLNSLTRFCVPYLIRLGLIKPLNPKFEISVPTGKQGSLKQIQKSKYQITKTKEIVDFKWLKKIVALEQERLKRLDEIGERAKFFFEDKLEYNPDILFWKKMTNEQVVDSLEKIKKLLSEISADKFKLKNIINKLTDLAKKNGVGEIFWPLRVALTGQKSSPPPGEIAEILGKEKTLERIEEAINKLKLSH